MKVALELQPCIKERSGIGVYTYELAKQLQINKEIELIGNLFQVGGLKEVQNELKELQFKQTVCPLMPYGIYKGYGIICRLIII